MNGLGRREALLLLNEHVGERVHAAVELDIGFGYQGVMNAEDVLTEMRWPEGSKPATPTVQGDAPTGLYRVGEATVYVPDQGFLSFTSSLSGLGIHVRLADNVGLTINWGQHRARESSLRHR